MRMSIEYDSKKENIEDYEDSSEEEEEEQEQ